MVKKKLVDAHCHLESFKTSQLAELPEEIIPVTSGYSHASNKRTLKIAKKMNLPFCMGIAPQTVLKEGKNELDTWMQFIADNPPNAIGECGLDYHWGKTKEEQELEEEVFLEMILLAQKMDLPLVIHSRNAETKCLDVLEEQNWKKPFMMHFFSGNLDEASRAVDMGGIISVIGLHSKNRKKVISEIPLEKLVVETDAPYITRNIDGIYPAIKYISENKKIPKEEVEKITAENAVKLFKIPL